MNCFGVRLALEDCAICFQPMLESCELQKLSCGHRFHHACDSGCRFGIFRVWGFGIGFRDLGSGSLGIWDKV